MQWEISGQICFSGQAQVAQKYWMQKYIQSSEKFQGTLCFSGRAQVAQILNDKKYIQYSEKFYGKLCFSGPAQLGQNFWMIKNKYIFTVKIFRAHSIFLGKHKLLKNPECKKYIQ